MFILQTYGKVVLVTGSLALLLFGQPFTHTCNDGVHDFLSIQNFDAAFSNIKYLTQTLRIRDGSTPKRKMDIEFPLVASFPREALNQVQLERILLRHGIDLFPGQRRHNDRIMFMVKDKWSFYRHILNIPHIRIEEEKTRDLYSFERAPLRTERTILSDNTLSETPFYDSINNPSLSCYRSVRGSYETIEYLSNRYPTLVDIVNIGPSYIKSIQSEGDGNGHELKVLRISSSKSSQLKPIGHLFIVCGLHPRELAPPEACARSVEHLLTKYEEEDADVRSIFDENRLVLHVLLQGNPDGRSDEEYHIALGDFPYYRRKNMHLCTNSNEQGRRCSWWCSIYPKKDGVDLNRNFPHEAWGTVGISSSKCGGDQYPGSFPSSEPETRALVDYIGQYADSTGVVNGVFLDIHSFGQALFWPWAFSREITPIHANQLKVLAERMASTTSVSGATGTYMADNEVYPTSGDSTDWAYEAYKLASYTIELGTNFYESCASLERDVVPNLKNMITYAARIASGPYTYPLGPHLQIESIDSTDRSSVIVYIIASTTSRVHLSIDSHFTRNATSVIVYELEGSEALQEDKRQRQQLNHKITFNATNMKDGRHVLHLRAYDSAEQQGPTYSENFFLASLKS